MLEELHDRRVEVTKAYDMIVQKLNRKAKSLEAALMIDQYSKIIQNIKDNINKINDVGKDKVECNKQIEALHICERDLMEISEKCLKLVAACETLDKALYGDVSMECTLHAYDSLQICTDLQAEVEDRLDIINGTVLLMDDFSICIDNLNNIESRIKNNGAPCEEDIKKTVSLFTCKARNLLDQPSSFNNSPLR